MSDKTISSGPFTFIPQGAIIQEWVVGGRNIVLGFRNPTEYENNPAYFGATIGRVANRIADGVIKNVPAEGDRHPLPVNNGPNTLHGGPIGWDKVSWAGPERTTNEDGSETLTFQSSSPHLDQQFPGALDAIVRYTIRSSVDAAVAGSSLEIEYEAKLANDSPVDWAIVSMTNHSYFNIGDQSTIEGTQVTIPDNTNIETNEVDIPTGALKPFPGIVSGQPFELGAQEPDIDHGFSLTTDVASVGLDTRSQGEKTCIKLYHPSTKINLVISSTEPAFQLLLINPFSPPCFFDTVVDSYTGKYIATEPRNDGTPAYSPRAGCCVEPARYTNAVNMPDWRHMVILKKGSIYGSRTTWKAWEDGTS